VQLDVLCFCWLASQIINLRQIREVFRQFRGYTQELQTRLAGGFALGSSPSSVGSGGGGVASPAAAAAAATPGTRARFQSFFARSCLAD
jgi:hypothetical protein